MMCFTAHVRDGRLVLDEPTDLSEGTRLELVLVDDDVSNDGDLLDAKQQAELVHDWEVSFAEEEVGQLVDVADAIVRMGTGQEGGMITFETITDEHVRWYRESMPDSPMTRDVIMAATSDLPVLRWLGRRRIAAAINVRAKAVK